MYSRSEVPVLQGSPEQFASPITGKNPPAFFAALLVRFGVGSVLRCDPRRDATAAFLEVVEGCAGVIAPDDTGSSRDLLWSTQEGVILAGQRRGSIGMTTR